MLNRAPAASIGMGTPTPVSLEPVVFTATATDPEDGPIASYLWDFDNDGQFDDASGESVPWTFAEEGHLPGQGEGHRQLRRERNRDPRP